MLWASGFQFSLHHEIPLYAVSYAVLQYLMHDMFPFPNTDFFSARRQPGLGIGGLHRGILLVKMSEM